jgi:hypothetical protein
VKFSSISKSISVDLLPRSLSGDRKRPRRRPLQAAEFAGLDERKPLAQQDGLQSLTLPLSKEPFGLDLAAFTSERVGSACNFSS